MQTEAQSPAAAQDAKRPSEAGTTTCYLADSSFYANSTGGRKYHLIGQDGCGSKCGLPMLNDDTGKGWDSMPDSIKCKRCAKAR